MSEKTIRIYADEFGSKPFSDITFEILTPRPFRIVNVKTIFNFQIFVAEFEGRYFIYSSDGFVLPPFDLVNEYDLLVHILLSLGLHPVQRIIFKAVLTQLAYDDTFAARSKEVPSDE